mmetsp:Transcript_3575/g.10101  ORF Transcript_3575/g.10101 Transcript_3575/m.10101 type:complete len:269 (-) Transcript_3575:66-872(-)
MLRHRVGIRKQVIELLIHSPEKRAVVRCVLLRLLPFSCFVVQEDLDLLADAKALFGHEDVSRELVEFLVAHDSQVSQWPHPRASRAKASRQARASVTPDANTTLTARALICLGLIGSHHSRGVSPPPPLLPVRSTSSAWPRWRPFLLPEQVCLELRNSGGQPWRLVPRLCLLSLPVTPPGLLVSLRAGGTAPAVIASTFQAWRLAPHFHFITRGGTPSRILFLPLVLVHLYRERLPHDAVQVKAPAVTVRLERTVRVHDGKEDDQSKN